ncbi:PhzF family phenazine biosynthesis protein [[Pasteurella] aerogenes]
MQIIPQFTVDTFSECLFQGDPTCVCLLEKCLPDELMLAIAQENNLPETAFIIPKEDAFGLRWFTPLKEIELCGHATLAAAFVIQQTTKNPPEIIQFHTLSGTLTVRAQHDWLFMNFPIYDLRQVPITESLVKMLGIAPQEVYLGRDLVCILKDEKQIQQFNPNYNNLLQLDGLLLHITAKGTKYDCISRSFAPKLAVNESHACASGHCHIFPYWAKRLEKTRLTGYQASSRGGVLHATIHKDHIVLGGKAVLFAKSELYLPESAVKTPANLY